MIYMVGYRYQFDIYSLVNGHHLQLIHDWTPQSVQTRLSIGVVYVRPKLVVIYMGRLDHLLDDIMHDRHICCLVPCVCPTGRKFMGKQ